MSPSIDYLTARTKITFLRNNLKPALAKNEILWQTQKIKTDSFPILS